MLSKLTQTNKRIKKNINYGIGSKSITKFKNYIGFNPRIKTLNFNKFQQTQFNKITKNLILNKTLKLFTKNSIEFIQTLRTYKGIRHKYKYPCRGQRTHTNANTKKKIKI